jgi:hypothetical protein
MQRVKLRDAFDLNVFTHINPSRVALCNTWMPPPPLWLSIPFAITALFLSDKIKRASFLYFRGGGGHIELFT